MSLQLFKSSEQEQRFQIAYDRLLATWATETTSLQLATDFGETHVLKTVGTNGPPLVLIPGGQGTAAMWGNIADALSEKRTIYAVDLIDQIGRSKPTRALTTPIEAADWLRQVIDELKLDEFDLAGNSIGAFIASSFAVQNSQRVKTLTLLAPAATISDLNPKYILSVLTAMMIPGTFSKKRFLRKTSAHQLDSGDPLFDLLLLAMSTSKTVSKLVPNLLPIVEADIPTLIILGDRDPVSAMPAERMQQTLSDNKNVTVEVLQGAGHLWTHEEFGIAASYLARILN